MKSKIQKGDRLDKAGLCQDHVGCTFRVVSHTKNEKYVLDYFDTELEVVDTPKAGAFHTLFILICRCKEWLKLSCENLKPRFELKARTLLKR